MKMKTLVAVPCGDMVDALFARSLSELAKVGDVTIEFEVDTLIHFSRDKLAAKALGIGAEFILWLDSDMVFQPDLMLKLMNDIEGRDFVTGIYHYRKPPYKPVIWEKYRNIDIHGESEKVQYLHYPKDRIFEIEACGFGGCLMRTAMIEKIMTAYGALFFPTPRCGEDMSFCARATKLGYKLWADPKIQLGHRGYMVCDWEQWDAWQQARTDAADTK